MRYKTADLVDLADVMGGPGIVPEICADLACSSDRIDGSVWCAEHAMIAVAYNLGEFPVSQTGWGMAFDVSCNRRIREA